MTVDTSDWKIRGLLVTGLELEFEALLVVLIPCPDGLVSPVWFGDFTAAIGLHPVSVNAVSADTVKVVNRFFMPRPSFFTDPFAEEDDTRRQNVTN